MFSGYPHFHDRGAIDHTWSAHVAVDSGQGARPEQLSILLTPFVKPIGHYAASIAQWLLTTLNVKSNTTRFGTFASVSYHFMMWLGMRRDAIIEELAQGLQASSTICGATEPESPLVIFWQSGSFMDLRNVGCDDLGVPTIDMLKDRAAQWGRLAVSSKADIRCGPSSPY